MRIESQSEKVKSTNPEAINSRRADEMYSFLKKYISFADSTDNSILCGVGILLDAESEINGENIRIPEFEDLTKEIDGLYIDDTQIGEMKTLYADLLDSRKNLSTAKCFSLKTLNSDFVRYAKEYLNSVRIFLRKIFSERINKSADVLPSGILKQIVESDMNLVPEGDAYYAEGAKTIRIDLANPLILSSLYLTRLQCDDFCELCSDIGLECDDPRCTMYAELLGNKVERLFRDCVILYEKEFYRIIDYDCDKFQFVARCENDLSSIEKINAIRLYEKIIKGADKEGVGQKIDCLVIGEVRRGSKELLERMLADNGNVSVEYKESRQEIHDILTHRDVFLGLINNYKKVFVLDCPEVYSSITMNEMSDDVDILSRSEGTYTGGDFSELLSVDDETEIRDFYNKNGFAAIYYRAQNYLVRPDLRNSSKARYVNRVFLNYIEEYFRCDESGKTVRSDLSGKEVYVYLSNNRDFKDELYDSYNFVRVERYNSKDCRIVKFSERTPVPFKSRERTVKTTYYKILKMLSNSGQFFCKMTAGSGNDVDSVSDAIKTAQRTKIYINYAPIADNRIPSHVKISFDVVCPEDCKNDSGRYDRYRKIVSDLVTEAFDPHRDDVSRTKNRVLIQCFQKAIACVISGCARNFNDLLFHHFYETLYKTKSMRFAFETVCPEFAESPMDDASPDEETTSYSYKRTAYALMSDLDSRWYRESDMVSHMRRTALNNEKLGYYVESIKDACRSLGYTYSALYSRLVRFYS